MGKKLLLLAALLSVALVGTTYAAVENIKVSGDLNSEAVVRDITLGVAPVTTDGDDDDQYAFTQIRLRFDADLTEGVSAVIRLINERLWGEETATDTGTDLDLAYVELKEFLYEQISLTIGRQNLWYGNGLIIGASNNNTTGDIDSITIGGSSLRKSFDAVKAVFDYAPFVLDLVYAKIEENTVDQDDDVNLMGLNVAYVWDSNNGITEAYLFGVNRAPFGTAADSVDPKNKVYVVGARNQLDLNDNFGLGLELAYQFGDYRTSDSAHQHLDAYAIQLNAEYKLLNDYDAKFGLQYTYLSGDDADSDNYQGWNPLFEDQSPGDILDTLFGNTNMQYLKASVAAVPREDVTIGLNYTYARLAEKVTANLSHPSSVSSTGTYALNLDKKDIGQEIDLVGIFDYTEDVQIKLAGGLFLPGHLFDKANDNSGYSVRAGINVDF